MIEDLSRRYDYRLHALLRPSLAHGIIIRILDRIKREKCLANWLASRGRSYRGLFPPAERNVFANFSYKAGFLEKSTSNCWRQKSGYRREIYIYKVWQKRKAQTLSNCRRRFSTNFSSFHSRNICNIFLENRFAIVAVSRRWYTSKRSVDRGVDFLRC